MLADKPYLTISVTSESEIEPIKGSRFIGFSAPIDSDEQALRFVLALRERYPDARHWCWAYQLRDQHKTRFSDDGEPNGSAGKPILVPIVGRNLLNTIVVVVRYFGGTKLGVGGLVRAYSQAANAVLDYSEIIEIVPKVRLYLTYDYAETVAVASALADLALIEKNPTYTDKIQSELQVVRHDIAMVTACLVNYTSGKITINEEE